MEYMTLIHTLWVSQFVHTKGHVLSTLVYIGSSLSYYILKAFLRPEVDGDVNMPQTGLCDRFLENRNHVWSDLSRLVDVECKKWPVVLLKACIFQARSLNSWTPDSVT